jgi:hypothetical protein
MACAEVAAANAKTIAINLLILSSYVNLQEAFLEARRSGEASRLGERLGSQDERYNTRFMNPVRRRENGWMY